MALDYALVDRARVVSGQRSGKKVEGRFLRQPVHGEWFAARLTMPAAAEAQDAAGWRRVAKAPTLLYGTDDERGQPVEVRVTDQVEVESEALGNQVWQVTSAPMPLRQREDLIGFEVVLGAVSER